MENMQMEMIKQVSQYHISEKIDFKTNSAVGDKDGHYIMIMESIQQQNITFVNICASNIGEHKCIKQI